MGSTDEVSLPRARRDAAQTHISTWASAECFFYYEMVQLGLFCGFGATRNNRIKLTYNNVMFSRGQSSRTNQLKKTKRSTKVTLWGNQFKRAKRSTKVTLWVNQFKRAKRSTKVTLLVTMISHLSQKL